MYAYYGAQQHTAAARQLYLMVYLVYKCVHMLKYIRRDVNAGIFLKQVSTGVNICVGGVDGIVIYVVY